ncbi:hypothetical protein JZ751_000337 [Albula glossodonta]|uniref:Tyrosyl-DNA phosphodiesterase 2 n=1 Tax=Albula glossodonta TaxID=121402 RepID=A0A8T2PVU9_9TELE|nr:hypothetical protein JZ751_000337 [Albula glossodonta]
MDDTKSPLQTEIGLEESRTRLCDEFASITSSESAVAQCYLAENDWDMERALNSFFEADTKAVYDEFDDLPDKSDTSERSKKEAAAVTGDCIDLTGDESACSSSTIVSESKEAPCAHGEKEDDGKLSLLTYTPDVVFLQELIPPYVQYLKKRAVSYTIIEGNEDGYFTGIMLKKSRVKLLKSEIVNYPTTRMMRNLLIAQERMTQFKMVLKRMKEAPDNVTVLFGGDTNLRDTEVAKVGGLPTGIHDIWEHLGRREHCRYTWDTKANSNKDVPYVSRCRFDRVYVRAAKEGPKVAPEFMNLVGLEKLDCGRYTSDHWGIYCSFTVGS